MKTFILTKVRLSWFFTFFFIVFLAALFMLPRIKFTTATLTLFSVNSFLYGFYISPILAAQKGRIEELHRIVRAEANAIFAIMLSIKLLPDSIKDEIHRRMTNYANETSRNHLKAAEKEYEELISFCVDYKGSHKDEMTKVLERLVANQQNRTNYAMQVSNKVFSNEWMVMLVLFSITLAFILMIDTGESFILKVVTALLCTALSMLILILVKLSTLTHKKARRVWDPLKILVASKYYRIDELTSQD
jgi:maltodextrin utilization protein YvdJ